VHVACGAKDMPRFIELSAGEPRRNTDKRVHVIMRPLADKFAIEETSGGDSVTQANSRTRIMADVDGC